MCIRDRVKLVRTAFNEDVDGYILKTGKIQLIEAIEEIMDGGRFFGEGVKIHILPEDEKALLQPSKFNDTFVKKYNLTKREVEILNLITQAMSNKEIAKQLFISDQTVSVHRKNIMRKLQVSNTAALIKMAYEKIL